MNGEIVAMIEDLSDFDGFYWNNASTIHSLTKSTLMNSTCQMKRSVIKLVPGYDVVDLTIIISKGHSDFKILILNSNL